LFEGDRPVRQIWDLIMANIRVGVERQAEIYAQFQAGRLVERRLTGYVEKFGLDTVRDAFEDTMDHSERLFRDWVSRLPDGSYEFTDYGDRDIGRDEQPMIKVHCRMTIEGDQVTVDWSDSGPAQVASRGFARPALQSAVYD